MLTHADIAATAVVYRRLLGAGNRLAVTAGTDTMISFTRSDNQSNPPGWARVYARPDGPLTAASFAEAVRARRTFATTGPWLELSVAGHGPGDTVAARPGSGSRSPPPRSAPRCPGCGCAPPTACARGRAGSAAARTR
ncbi:hypothetical protein OIE66_23340 [Nonomuraea sp. NBC_01738]|uniref:hypothetical protein n=1 Tax=Nonomuraea sp. NBC_01738 TaxID=2976003 RepID=UPI002E156CE4|nr:hypothetical protein OIE66_23340 [Nonomuraea sp. NBC_01738]